MRERAAEAGTFKVNEAGKNYITLKDLLFHFFDVPTAAAALFSHAIVQLHSILFGGILKRS